MAESASHTSPSLRVDDQGVAWVTFDDPVRKHNVLDEPVMRRLAELLDELARGAATGQVRVVVFESAKPDSFIAGADVDAIAAIEDPAEGEAKSLLGQAIYLDLERLKVPTVAAIHGVCLGGGLELTLACRFRVCSDAPATRLGLPEVQLGLLPGWGGTTRLPRLLGLQAALGLLLQGEPVRASRARRLGLVSEVFPAELFRDEVRKFALEVPSLPDGASRPDRGLGKRLLEDSVPGRRIVLATAKRQVLKRTGGHYPAPLKILEVLRKSAGSSVTDALAVEARAFGELTATSVHRNLLHLFRLREEARKTSRAVPGGEARAIRRVGVVGAGVMGGGVAQLAAYHDLDVQLKDIQDDAVASGLHHARELFDRAVERRKLSGPEADRKMAHIRGGLEYHGFATLDLVVEAVVEKMEVKRTVLTEVEGRVPEGCVLTTNTSSLSIDAMAEVLSRPHDFVGMHFFNPVHKMPLVEVVRGRATADDAVATVHALAVALGKVPVVCRDGPGFLVNRILGPYLNEAGWLLSEGASIEAVDRAATAFGMPMGPLRLIDEVGIDIARHAGATLAEAFGERLAPSPPLTALGETSRLGRKNGRGFYRYEKGKAKGPDDAVYAELAGAVPQARQKIGENEIRTRLILAMINEAATVLEDDIVASAADVDLGMIMGTGFPPFRGGLIRFADTHHPRSLVERLRGLEARLGSRFAPAPLLLRLAEENRSFYDAFPASAARD
jgi:3-hydroxyacyl-CoA dehydrogenase / enoyl-CoA hydratase / 3-hydroxybutyryl-CoA epimerase